MRFIGCSFLHLACLVVAVYSAPIGLHLCQAATLEELQSVQEMCPERFASYFSGFEYEFRAEVQSPETFLTTRSGDCDDYAVLAAEILRSKGFTPRLIAVRMPGLVHVICYIEETKSYLDYNRRNAKVRTVSCGNSINEISNKVARSFKVQWISASEFKFHRGSKWLVATVPYRDENSGFKSFFSMFSFGRKSGGIASDLIASSVK